MGLLFFFGSSLDWWQWPYRPCHAVSARSINWYVALAFLAVGLDLLIALVALGGARTLRSWAIVNGVLVLASILLLAVAFEWWHWPYANEMTVSHRLVNVWVSVAVAILALGPLIILMLSSNDNVLPRSSIIALHEFGIREPWTDCGEAADPALIREAAERMELAVENVAKLQLSVAAARRNLAASQGPDEERNRKAELDAQLGALREAKKKRQQEQKLLAINMQSLAKPASADIWTTRLQYAVFGTPALIVLIFLMYGMINELFLPKLASIAVSRGLITFLIAVVTVTIALILVLATIVSENEQRKERFTQGKEILTMLIGVLGTIVGFYFGNSLDGAKPLVIAHPVISSDSPTAGQEIDITSSVAGGQGPYTYQVVFTPPTIITNTPKEMQSDGPIRLMGLKTAPVTKDTPFSYQIKVHDHEGRTAT